MNNELDPLAAEVGAALRSKGMMLATAESCTGGGISEAITDIAGSSAWFDRGFVTYSYEAKVDLLGVKRETLVDFGAVSEQTALEMVGGAIARSRAQVAVAVTGIAGPGGAVPGKPVGLVHFAACSRTRRIVYQERQFGDIGRTQVREASVAVALAMLQELAETE